MVVDCIYSVLCISAKPSRLTRAKPTPTSSSSSLNTPPRVPVSASSARSALWPRLPGSNGWTLAHRLQARLQGQSSFPPADGPIETLVKKVRRGRPAPAEESPTPASVTITVDPERVTMEEPREAGTVHVGHQVWQQLGLREILQRAGLSDSACQLSEAMTLNRLIFPLSEHAMPDWMRRTAVADILGVDFSSLHDDALYGTLDRLNPKREHIATALAEREIGRAHV